MSLPDLHEYVVRWPHTDAVNVLVTGTFDEWKSSVRLERTPTGFEGPIHIPFGQKIQYKFVVDGRWVTDDAAPTTNEGGFVNNVYTAPERPEVVQTEPTAPAVSEAPAAPEPVQETAPVPEAPSPAVEEAKVEEVQAEEPKEVAAPVAEPAAAAPAPSTPEPPKTMFGYAKGVAASFFPTLSPKGSRSSTPVPAPPPAKTPETTTSVTMPIVPVGAPLDDSQQVLPTSEDAHSHIPLPPPGKSESSPAADAAVPETAPAVLAAEPVKADAEGAKEVTDAAPVAVVETAAAPSSPVETKVEESAATEAKVEAPEVLAAPAPDAQPKEVVPVVPQEDTDPEPATEDVAKEEPAKEETAKEPAKDEPVKEAAAVAPTTPKKGSPNAPSTPPSNGHSRFGTLRTGSIRKLAFPHRRSSSQTHTEGELATDKSPASSVKDARKKRESFFGKVKDVFSHKEHKNNGATAESK